MTSLSAITTTARRRIGRLTDRLAGLLGGLTRRLGWLVGRLRGLAGGVRRRLPTRWLRRVWADRRGRLALLGAGVAAAAIVLLGPTSPVPADRLEPVRNGVTLAVAVSGGVLLAWVLVRRSNLRRRWQALVAGLSGLLAGVAGPPVLGLGNPAVGLLAALAPDVGVLSAGALLSLAADNRLPVAFAVAVVAYGLTQPLSGREGLLARMGLAIRVVVTALLAAIAVIELGPLVLGGGVGG